MTSAVVGLWTYESRDTGEHHSFIVEEHRKQLFYRQELKDVGLICEALQRVGQWYEVNAPHGLLRLKPAGKDQVVSQFKQKETYSWGSPLLSKRTQVDITGLFYQGDSQGKCQVNKRICTITEEKIKWFSGPDVFYHWIDRERIQVRLEGERYVGTIKDDGNEIHWNDGDLWIRKTKKKFDGSSRLQLGRKANLRKVTPKVLTKISSENRIISNLEERYRLYEQRSNSTSALAEDEEEEEEEDVEDFDGPNDVNSLLKKAMVNKAKNKFQQGASLEDRIEERKRLRARKMSSKTMRWDEKNLDKNNRERVPRMKIDDPPTPFSGEADEELLELDENFLADPPEFSLYSGANTLLLQSDDFWKHVEKKVEENKKAREEENDLDEDEKAEREFDSKRKAHYNEGHIWKAMKANPSLLEDESDFFE